jgi:predicted transglutaminase-like cysteine proteinase
MGARRMNFGKSIWRFGMIAALAAAAGSVRAADPPVPSFFNSIEARSDNLAPFKKWNGVLERYAKEVQAKNKGKCLSKNLNICDYDDWLKFLEPLKKQDKLAQIRAINHHFNQAKYVTDKSNWGQNDLWNTPAEFMANFGDCEDYAIVKYMSLRHLGFEERELRIVAVKDLNLKVGHAILLVFWIDPRNGKERALVLDNQIDKVVDARAVRHYQPVFSINSQHWWRHSNG